MLKILFVKRFAIAAGGGGGGMRRRDTSRALSTRGMTLIEAVVVLAVIVILVGIMIPSGRHGHDDPFQTLKCRNNLKNVGLSHRIWATDNADRFPFEVSTNSGGSLELRNDIAAQFRVLSNELGTPKTVVCPRWSPGRIAATNWASLTAANIGYYIGLNARATNDASILSGDTGFTINGVATEAGINEIGSDMKLEYPQQLHNSYANILRSDGSVFAFKNKEWPKYLRAAGSATNLILMP